LGKEICIGGGFTHALYKVLQVVMKGLLDAVMSILNFLQLLRSIYGKRLPNLAKIQAQGLLAVKIAQHFALRIDFLDEKVCRHLAQLYRKTIPLPAEDLDHLLRTSVHASWFDAFSRIEKVPFASASVGQVHEATLQDGTEVVIKIIKKDFSESFLRDLRSLRRFLRVLLFFYPKLRRVFDPMGILDHIEDYTLTELNLLHEIEGQDRLREIAERHKDHHDLSRLRFVKIYRELTNERVLVAERIRGPSFDELLEKGQLTYDLLLELFSIHGFFLFGPGVFHGDIHPGNILLGQGRELVFIDTGALSQIGEKIRRGLFGFFLALGEGDHGGCVRSLNEMADRSLEEAGLRRFQKEFEKLYRDFGGSTVSQVSLTRKMMDTIKLAVNCGMEFERGMFSIIKSLMYLDGMVLRCNPDAVLVADMRPALARFKRSLESS